MRRKNFRRKSLSNFFWSKDHKLSILSSYDSPTLFHPILKIQNILFKNSTKIFGQKNLLIFFFLVCPEIIYFIFLWKFNPILVKFISGQFSVLNRPFFLIGKLPNFCGRHVESYFAKILFLKFVSLGNLF